MGRCVFSFYGLAWLILLLFCPTAIESTSILLRQSVLKILAIPKALKIPIYYTADILCPYEYSYGFCPERNYKANLRRLSVNFRANENLSNNSSSESTKFNYLLCEEPLNRNLKWHIRLLRIDDVELATDLVLAANAGRPERQQRFIPEVLRESLQKELRSKIYNGFLARCGDRLQDPSTCRTAESAIIAAYDIGSSELVGVVEVYPTEPAYLCNLAVAESARRQGLAVALCRTVDSLCLHEWDIKEISLQVDRANRPARKLYEALGFRAVSNYGPLPSLDSIFLGESHLVSYRKPT